MFIGKKVKEIRRKIGMTLSGLSEQSGVQIATLSRIENMKMTGTLESHISIAKVLEVDVTELYTDIVPREDTITHKIGQTEADIFVDSNSSSFEMLTNNVLKKKMMPTLLTIEPQGRTTEEQAPAGAEKFIFVLEGKIDVVIGTTEYTLNKKNTLYFKSSTKHYFVNKSNSKAKILSIQTPVSL